MVEEVRASEPDALVYAVHSVPNAPMQRIFYEVYRDQTAYEEHKRHSYIKRFDVERAPFVLATNVIELEHAARPSCHRCRACPSCSRSHHAA